MKILWTDGSADPNPGPGGYAVLDQNGNPVRLGRADETTNVRMEGTAIIEAMKYAGEEGCEIHTDSQLWVNILTQWAQGWEQRCWTKRNGKIKNLQMVREAWRLYNKYPVKLCFVRGHMGTELNELADIWANRAREGETIKGEKDEKSNC
ncbi:ribonuclease HI [Candidatus Saccharibacteria bacterium]|nr:ribonuclease HI [Candidatus Saccharibacteria bacterium]